MSNKTQLQPNNTALDGYIARINAAKDVAAGLPEAGDSGSSGGGGATPWTGRITPEAVFPTTLTVYYTDSNMTAQTTLVSSETTLEIAANTIIFISGNICDDSSGCVRLGGGTGSYAYLITANNFVITVPMM